MNVSFAPIRAHFEPLPEIKINTTRCVEVLTRAFSNLSGEQKLTGSSASLAITVARLVTGVSSHLISPHLLVPLGLWKTYDVLSNASLSDPVSLAGNLIALGVLSSFVSNYTKDGTLGKLSNDLFKIANEAQEVALKLKDTTEVTFVEPPQLPNAPKKYRIFDPIIDLVNDLFRAVFNFFVGWTRVLWKS